ncbi:FAD-dependent oxidoreductase [Oenococcus sicerae]|uniref:FAD-dependent oxidoreductase n=1 Tax=Oenococcus sicerae TaxID=2203724 RepID=UPI0039EAC845
MTEKHVYDTIIVGAGPAGLSAGIYAGRAALDTLLIEKDQVGGQVTTTSVVWNYPAAQEISGSDLAARMQRQLSQFAVPIQKDNIESFDLNQDVKVLHGKTDHYARSVIFATGANPRKAGFIGEDQYRGHGVAYCSTCDGDLFSGLQVFVIGGGYSAAEEADYLTKFARHVTIIVRGSKFTCAKLTAARALNNPKISIRYNTILEKVSGDQYLTEAVFIDQKTHEKTSYHVQQGDETFGIFVFVGTQPASSHLAGVLDLDDQAYLKVTSQMATKLPGVFAAGDVVAKSLRQIVTAAADGALAATSAESYVSAQKARLGIPIVQKTVVKTAPQQSRLDDSSHEAAHDRQTKWFSEQIRAQLKPIFAKLTRPQVIKELSDSSVKSQELASFSEELCSLDSHLSFEKVEVPDQQQAGLLPALILLDENGQDSGLRFSGVPTGHELNSIVLAIYNLAGPGQHLAADLVKRIKRLPKMNLQIGVSLTCHFCPDVVSASQRIASMNPVVSAEMIDLQLFPKIRQAKKIMSVPAFMIDGGEVTFGSQTIDQIVDLCEKAAVSV